MQDQSLLILSVAMFALGSLQPNSRVLSQNINQHVADKVRFHLYTKNPTLDSEHFVLGTGDLNALHTSDFNASHATRYLE